MVCFRYVLLSDVMEFCTDVSGPGRWAAAGCDSVYRCWWYWWSQNYIMYADW